MSPSPHLLHLYTLKLHVQKQTEKYYLLLYSIVQTEKENYFSVFQLTLQ